jgi:hypothetical protein
VDARELGRHDHGAVVALAVKAPDVGGHRVGEKLDVLRQEPRNRPSDSRGQVETSAPSSRTVPAEGASTPTICPHLTAR